MVRYTIFPKEVMMMTMMMIVARICLLACLLDESVSQSVGPVLLFFCFSGQPLIGKAM